MIPPWSSPWDGGDRRALSVVLGVVAGWDLLALAFELVSEPATTLVHPAAPVWLLALARSRVAVLALAAVGIFAAALFARGRRPVTTALLVLACSGVLVEAAAASGPGPYRARFFVGAMLLGTIVGRLWSRISRDEQPARAAEVGAVAMLAATYLGAATSKLGGAGLSWIDATTLRAVALAHTPVDQSRWLADAPALARTLASATLVVQLGALLYPWWSRTRIVAGLALVGFHVGVAVFAGIGYWEPVVLLLAFSLPWPRWVPRLRAEVPATLTTRDPLSGMLHAAAGRANAVMLAVLLVLVALAWLLPWRRYTDLHHRPRGLDGGVSVARESVQSFGPLAIGDALARGWVIDALAREPRRAMVVLRHDEHGRVVLWVSPKREGDRRSPFDRGHVRVAYEGDDARMFAAAARELATRLDAAAGDPSVVERWLVD